MRWKLIGMAALSCGSFLTALYAAEGEGVWPGWSLRPEHALADDLVEAALTCDRQSPVCTGPRYVIVEETRGNRIGASTSKSRRIFTRVDGSLVVVLGAADISHILREDRKEAVLELGIASRSAEVADVTLSGRILDRKGTSAPACGTGKYKLRHVAEQWSCETVQLLR